MNKLLAEMGNEAVPEADWDAPEQGSTPPPVVPGIYSLKLRMPEQENDWFNTIEVEVVKGQPKKKFPVIMFRAEAVALITATEQQPIPVDAASGMGPTLNFLRASLYKPEKFPLSQGDELIRALGYRTTSTTWAQKIADITAILREANGRALFRADVGWEAFFKTTETRVSTNPNRKRGDIPWTKNADGSYAEYAINPSNGEKMFGRCIIVRFKLPTSDNAS